MSILMTISSEQVDFICAYLAENENSLGVNLEIVGNILLRVGAEYMDLPENDAALEAKEFIELVMADRKKNGETIANATVLQGLTLLNWLQQGDES